MMERFSVRGLVFRLGIASLRGFSFVGRFALSFFLARFLGVSEIGEIGLISGVAGIAPNLCGFGLNHFYCRRLVGSAPVHGCRLILSRMSVSFGFSVLCLFGAMAYFGLIGRSIFHGLLVGSVVGLELFSLDLNMTLVSLRKPVVANVALFCRSAFWTFPFIAIAYFSPAYRSVDFVLVCWIVGGLLGCFLGIKAIASSFARVDMNVGDRRGGYRWLIATGRRSWLIYLSDLGLVGAIYLDRFLINGSVGLSETGVFLFYWTIANALQVVVFAGVVQVATPALLDAFAMGDRRLWLRLLWSEAKRAVAIVVVLAVCAQAFVLLVVGFVRRPELDAGRGIMPVLLAASVLRVVADVVNAGLYCVRADRAYALINIGILIVGIAFTLFGLWMDGISGAAVGMVCSALLSCLLRGQLLRTRLR